MKAGRASCGVDKKSERTDVSGKIRCGKRFGFGKDKAALTLYGKIRVSPAVLAYLYAYLFEIGITVPAGNIYIDLSASVVISDTVLLAGIDKEFLDSLFGTALM